MFVIGTAGHIDHGKSSLITRLTGIDPDRLPEEKERGMTIDIGFAHYDTPDGKRIGIIDVPGHERFVRNMIAGAGGIDAVILVVAADDGWMPQSQEHFQVTKLLGIKYGIVAITKIDLVDDEWIDVVEEDVRDKLNGSFLEKAPIVRVSSSTGEGFDALKGELERLAEIVVEREDISKPRLYVDRSFVLQGMGGVVAGTLRGGTLTVGQDIAVFPAGKRGKIRTVQSHGSQIDKAEPGQRTSMSLTGIDKQYLGRGCVMTTPEIIQDYPGQAVFALDVAVLPESNIELENGRRLLMILGTTEIEGEIRVFGGKEIHPGGDGLVFFKPFDPVMAFIGDHCIFRLPTPQATVGGGTILDILDRFPRKKELGRFEYLRDRKELTLDSLVATSLDKSVFINTHKDLLWTNFSQKDIDSLIESMKRDGRLDTYRDKYYRPNDLSPVIGRIVESMTEYFETHPHMDGMTVDRIASFTSMSISAVEPILELIVDKGTIIKKKNRFDIPGRAIGVKGDIKKAADEIEKQLLDGKFAPPTVKELLGNDNKRAEAFDYLVTAGLAVRAGGQIVFHRDHWKEIITEIKSFIESGKELSVSSLREKLGNSRKYALPILEETDRLKITERQGDIRVKGENYEKE